MPAARKPNPKSQKQISNDQVDPYVFPETDESYGNPNIPSEFNQFTANKQSGVDFNRSEQMSFKGDTTKPFTIGLQDIDESIMFYFQNVIRPFVYQNGVRIEVPIIYGSPEKWKSVQKDGYYKDKNGAIMSPLIMFKRDTIDKNRSLTNKLDANAPHLYTSWRKPYNGKNSYSNFSVLTNRIPVDQFVVNVVPDYVTLTYSCTIQTYYIDQLNKIIEAVNYASDSYWGDPERFKFKASIDSYSTVVEMSDNSNRVVKGTFTIKLFGYVIPDTVQKEVTAIKKYNSKAQVIIGIETVNGLSEFVSTSNKKKQQFNPTVIAGGGGGTGGGGTIDPATLTYLNTNIQQLGTFVNTTTITFASGWLPAPAGVPATSINNFSIFVNGQLIELAAIVSFTESGGVTTLVINETELGFGFDSMDEVIAIGKFANNTPTPPTPSGAFSSAFSNAFS
jgi:hypothetical protein